MSNCNICDRPVEIVKYNDVLDLALCSKCVERPQAIENYLIELMTSV